MKLITWNIQWGRGVDGRVDLERIVATARGLCDFDVICFQEVADNFPGLEGNDATDQFAAIAALLPGYRRTAAFAVDLAGENGRRRRFGNMLLTRYDLIAVRRHALPWPADPAQESMPRVALEATIQAPAGPMRVTTTHLEYYSDSQRRAQAARLRHLQDEACHRAAHPRAASGDGSPFDAPPQTSRAILVGDFNFQPDSPEYEDIQAPLTAGRRYRDAWRVANGRTPHPPSFCLHDSTYSRSPYCCDFAFVSDDLAPRVRAVRIDQDTQASDHQPLVLELDDH